MLSLAPCPHHSLSMAPSLQQQHQPPPQQPQSQPSSTPLPSLSSSSLSQSKQLVYQHPQQSQLQQHHPHHPHPHHHHHQHLSQSSSPTRSSLLLLSLSLSKQSQPPSRQPYPLLTPPLSPTVSSIEMDKLSSLASSSSSPSIAVVASTITVTPATATSTSSIETLPRPPPPPSPPTITTTPTTPTTPTTSSTVNCFGCTESECAPPVNQHPQQQVQLMISMMNSVLDEINVFDKCPITTATTSTHHRASSVCGDISGSDHSSTSTTVTTNAPIVQQESCSLSCVMSAPISYSSVSCDVNNSVNRKQVKSTQSHQSGVIMAPMKLCRARSTDDSERPQASPILRSNATEHNLFMSSNKTDVCFSTQRDARQEQDDDEDSDIIDEIVIVYPSSPSSDFDTTDAQNDSQRGCHRHGRSITPIITTTTTIANNCDIKNVGRINFDVEDNNDNHDDGCSMIEFSTPFDMTTNSPTNKNQRIDVRTSTMTTNSIDTSTTPPSLHLSTTTPQHALTLLARSSQALSCDADSGDAQVMLLLPVDGGESADVTAESTASASDDAAAAAASALSATAAVRTKSLFLNSTPSIFTSSSISTSSTTYDSAVGCSTSPSPCPSPSSCPSLPLYFDTATTSITSPYSPSSATSDDAQHQQTQNRHCTDHEQHSEHSLDSCSQDQINYSNSGRHHSSDTLRTSKTSHNLQSLPPSVVISDHSLDEVRVVHDFDLDVNSFKQRQFNQMNNPMSDLGNYLLSNSNVRRDSLSSICSSTSSLSSLGEGDSDCCFVVCDGQFCCVPPNNSDAATSPNSVDDSHIIAPPSLNTSPWRKIRSLVTSPFIQTYKRQKYPWIQLAGHQGNFMAGQLPGTILKKLSGNEERCFKRLMADDHLKQFVPDFKETVVVNGETYLELEDLLANFTNPSIMDIKMGLRTYLEEELIKAGEKPKWRKDMYEKMVAIDPNEPKSDEHTLKAVTKPRYMIWRESISSTSTLGFRIDGVKLRSSGSGENSCRMVKHDFKRTKTEDSVRASVELFADEDYSVLCKYLTILKSIRKALKLSEFFRTHEMIGSSLLFVHDEERANIWLIDFAKTCPLPDGISIDHSSDWNAGNHEDGYLVGLDNLIRIFSQLCDMRQNNDDNSSQHPPSPSECVTDNGTQIPFDSNSITLTESSS